MQLQIKNIPGRISLDLKGEKNLLRNSIQKESNLKKSEYKDCRC